MSRKSYVIDVWLPENGPWLALICAVVGCVTAPSVPGAGAQALAWLGAAVFWFGFALVLVGVLWRPWGEPAPERREPPVYDAPPAEAPAPSGEVVPLRPAPPPKGLH